MHLQFFKILEGNPVISREVNYIIDPWFQVSSVEILVLIHKNGKVFSKFNHLEYLKTDRNISIKFSLIE